MHPTALRLARALRAALLATAFAAAPRAPAATPVTYVALGDSTAVGVGAQDRAGYPARLARRLEASGIAVRLVNLGVSGATVVDLRRDQLPKALTASPQLVTIGIGINDVLADRSLRDFARELQVVADLVIRTKAVVVISTLPDLTLSHSAKDAPPSLGRRVAEFNAAIETVAERYGFLVADVWGASRAAVRAGGPEAFFAGDGLHPSAVGYERWVDALWPTTERALALKVQPRRAGADARQP